MTERTLSDFNHARLRLEMYLGSREPHTQNVMCFNGSIVEVKELTWVPSLYTAVREIIDNSMDEIAAHGHGDTIWISYDPDTLQVEVKDNGRGIPIHEIPSVGKGPAASYMMSNPRSGRNFDERGTVAGVNGLGAAIVNFTSETFDLQVWRDTTHFRQSWSEGVYSKVDIHKTNGPTTEPYHDGFTGTQVSFRPSRKVWPIMELPLEFIESRVWDIAISNPNITVWFNGSKLQLNEGRDPVISTMFPPNTDGGHIPVIIETQTDRVHAKFYAVTGVVDDEHIHSLVNNIPTLLGGSHVDEFRNLFYNGLIKHLDTTVKAALKIKPNGPPILTRKDVTHGVLLYNITMMDDPHFDSQSKTRLVSEIKSEIKSGFFESDVKGFIRKNPKWVAEVIDRCGRRTQATNSRQLKRDQKKLSKTKIPTLRDATGKNRQKCVLYITEGESALSGIVSARDATIHGGLPLRGKVMNTHGVTPKAILASESLTNIMTAIGLKLGEPANRMHLRYGKIYITTDADHDGKNITSQLVAFFHTHWPELFMDSENPFIFDFDTPLVILVKGKDRQYVYDSDYSKFDPSEWKGWQIIRAKGLARLTQADWKSLLGTPKLVPLLDDGKLSESIDLIFNPARSKDRQKWLS